MQFFKKHHIRLEEGVAAKLGVKGGKLDKQLAGVATVPRHANDRVGHIACKLSQT